MMSRLRKFGGQYGYAILLRLLLSPVISLVTTPICLARTLWKSRVLWDLKNCKDYPNFRADLAFNYLFYWTNAFNLYTHGRAGQSDTLALGKYPLSRCFHYCAPSLYAFWKAGAATILGGMFIWWGMHFVWLPESDPAWVCIVMLAVLLSNTFYTQAFGRQNYNVVGWAFFPLTLYGLYNEAWIVAAAGIFLSSFGSITVVVFCNVLLVAAAIHGWTIAPLIAAVPANLKLLTHFYPFAITGNMKRVFAGIMKAIGMVDRNVKYKRQASKRLGIRGLYFLLLYGLFCGVAYLCCADLPVYVLTGVAIFLVNSMVIRIADSQSMHMLMMSLAAGWMFMHPHAVMLAPFWLLLSPMPIMLNFVRSLNRPDALPVLAPVSVRPLLDEMTAFCEPAAPGTRILMLFGDPAGSYERVFDGYRRLIEAPFHVCNLKGVHLLPNWWGVFEVNYEGAPGFWGRDLESALRNAAYWDADFVIVYQQDEPVLDEQWTQAGFEVLSHFSWPDFIESFKPDPPLTEQLPHWWLLKVPRDESSASE
jgi:hypothetical protein